MDIEKLDKLARDVLILSRNTLLVNLRFLDSALSMFSYVPYDGTIATEGKHILYNTKKVLERYKDEKERPVRDYLHIVMHCIFRHMFVSPTVNRDYWDLACDIAAEYAISGLNLKSCETRLSGQQKDVFNKLESEIKHLTAEKIYDYYMNSNLSPSQMANLRAIFFNDDHFLWYAPSVEVMTIISKAGSNSDSEKDDKGESKGTGSSDGDSQQNSREEQGGAGAYRKELEEAWSDISQRMQTDLETFAKEQGDKAGGLMQNLAAVNREKYDYTAFLKKFAVMGEAMKINDDEFDYIFYTYGMKLYEKMPLIEPLEYKEVKRIKEFVIAIDTSGSVEGELVQMFIQKTYNILKSTESFFSKINLHIIQCDAEIQECVKITSQEEFDEYLKNMTLHGFGGTDFRPVFTYIDKLVKQKEFRNLKGLIYFTDGWGTFPEKKPGYDTAFVFIDEDYNNFDVPPWAIKLILQKDEI